jgi:hypothetical protein
VRCGGRRALRAARLALGAADGTLACFGRHAKTTS